MHTELIKHNKMHTHRRYTTNKDTHTSTKSRNTLIISHVSETRQRDDHAKIARAS
jgi:hypothetical protein